MAADERHTIIYIYSVSVYTFVSYIHPDVVFKRSVCVFALERYSQGTPSPCESLSLSLLCDGRGECERHKASGGEAHHEGEGGCHARDLLFLGQKGGGDQQNEAKLI